MLNDVLIKLILDLLVHGNLLGFQNMAWEMVLQLGISGHANLNLCHGVCAHGTCRNCLVFIEQVLDHLGQVSQQWWLIFWKQLGMI